MSVDPFFSNQVSLLSVRAT